ncbi:hypothetical protein K8I61_06130 [bacterium]|nr:hypothetical protein [bacterium]
MSRGRIVFLVAGGLFLAFLLFRSATGGMVPPWPHTVETQAMEPQYNEFGLLVGENAVTTGATSWKGPLTWFAAFLTLCILSFLYDDNPLYKFAEHLFVGVSAAYWMVMGFWTTLVPNLFGKLTPNLVSGVLEGVKDNTPEWHYVIPLIFGILLLTRISEKFGYLSRLSLAFIVGTTAGLNFVQYLKSDFMLQITQTITPLVAIGAEGFSFWGTFSNIVLFVGVICGLIYFFFSKEHTGVFGAASRIGIWVLMISFGASFGFTVMGRIALLVGRMEFLLRDWMNLVVG